MPLFSYNKLTLSLIKLNSSRYHSEERKCRIFLNSKIFTKNAKTLMATLRLYVSCLYGLPKIHQDRKEPPQTHCQQYEFYDIQQCKTSILDTTLALLVGYKEHHIQNSKECFRRSEELKLDVKNTMVSYDITSHFTSSPTTEALTVIGRRWKKTAASTQTRFSRWNERTHCAIKLQCDCCFM